MKRETIISIVTYRRPDWAVEVIRSCAEEGVPVWVTANCSSFTESHERAAFEGFQRTHYRVYRPTVNLGAGGGRNLHIQDRPDGSNLFRLDDDWVFRKSGWLKRCIDTMRWQRSAVVMASNDVTPGVAHLRLPDCNGNYLVRGDCVDALGGFYLGFGGTLLDDLEYTRRAVQWAKAIARLPRGIVEFGEPMRDLCAELGGNANGGWLPPWSLFEERCAAIESGSEPLYVPPDGQRVPGWEQRDAGIPDTEREYEW